jgi:hypothetical protein
MKSLSPKSLPLACLLCFVGLMPAAGLFRSVASAAQPNIVFVLCDDHRFDCLGASLAIPI